VKSVRSGLAWLATLPLSVGGLHAQEDGAAQVRALLADYRLGPARTAAQELLAVATAAAGERSLAAAQALDLLAEAARRRNDADARALAQRALTLKETLVDPDDPELAVSLHNLASLDLCQGSPAAARAPLQRAVAILRRAPDARLGMSLVYLGKLESDLGDLEGAIALFDEAERVQREFLAEDHVDTAYRLHYRALVDQSLGRFERARGLLERALDVRTRALRADHPLRAATLNNLALVLRSLGDIVGARRCFVTALQIKEQQLEPDNPTRARGRYNLATWLDGVGDSEAAARQYRIALAALGNDEHPCQVELRGACRVGLGRLLALAGKNDEARAALQTAADELAALPACRPRVFALRQLGHLWLAAGDWDRAAIAFGDAERAVRGLGAPAPEVAACRLDQGALHAARGEFDRALAEGDSALALLESAHGPDSDAVARARAELASWAAGAGRHGRALDEALAAEAIGREHARRNVAGLIEGHGLGLVTERPSALALAERLVADDPQLARRAGEVLDAIVRARGLLLEETGLRQRLIATAEQEDPGIAQLAGAVREANEKLARLASCGGEPAALADARATLDALEQELAEKCLPLRSALVRNRIGLDEVRAALPADAALVAFSRSGERYVAFTLRAGEALPCVHALGTLQRIDALVELWRSALRFDEATYRRVAAELRAVVWDPLRAALGDAPRAFIVADGALQLVHFAALPDGADRYLVEASPQLHVLSVERDLVELAQPGGARGSGLLALGGPAYDLVAGARGGSRWAALPAAAAEAAEVAALWQQAMPRTESARVRTGAAATEARFKAEAPGCRVLHVATHGFFDGAGAPAGARGRPAGGGDRATPLAPREAMQRAGLVFAGANDLAELDSSEDGVLTAAEIALLPLHGVEWAVLSACDTGVGATQCGEGVFGLRRAFRIAGVRTVLMSLWPVRDDVARSWTAALYRARLQDGMDTAAAVRCASRTLLEELRRAAKETHPTSWAAFLAVGDWR
jgi:CHAT domain-containing protein